MNNKPTLAIYGIKDRNMLQYPAYVHDHNLCIMQNGKILQYLQLERFTRRKYDNRLDLYLEHLIDNKLVELPSEFDLVSVNNFIGNAFISKNGRLRIEANKNSNLRAKLDKAFSWYHFSDWEGKEITAYNCPHELAHISSCLPFFGTFRDNSLLISFDGASSLGNFAAFHFKNGEIKLLENHWELSYLSKFFNDNSLSFGILNAKPGEHASVPGKLMGYASYGTYDSEIEKWLVENGYFKNYWNKSKEIFDSIKNTFDISIANFDNKNSFLQDVAGTFQYIFERDFILKIEQLQKETGADYLYYAGGCALNIVTNTKIIEKHIFKDVFIPPCCNDSGLSVGGASFLEWQKGNTISLHSPYLCNVGLKNEEKQTVSVELIKETAKLILDKKIIAVCNNNAEIGPRALGNRSLIGLANNKQLAQKVSMSIKKREWYRPIAPIMLEKIAKKVTSQNIHHLSKFMLLDFTINRQFNNELRGVIHFNQTSRIQTINTEKDNPFMFNLLTYLYENHNVLALINTSFNVQGEPIVHTHEEALNSAKKMGIDAIIINNIMYKL